MNSIKFDNFLLIFTPNYIQIEIFDEAHYSVKNFEECFQLKLEIYGNKKIGVLVNRTHPEYTFSFDPMLLITGNKLIEKHAKWVILVSDKLTDILNLQFVKLLTNIFCLRFSEYEDALIYINSNNLPD